MGWLTPEQLARLVGEDLPVAAARLGRLQRRRLAVANDARLWQPTPEGRALLARLTAMDWRRQRRLDLPDDAQLAPTAATIELLRHAREAGARSIFAVSDPEQVARGRVKVHEDSWVHWTALYPSRSSAAAQVQRGQ